MQATEVPRRELNRLRTWDAIHQTAARLVLARGLAKVTIDEIAETANVSRRTFFNYFPTKEDAVLGTRPAQLSTEDLAEFDASVADPFGRIVRLMAAAIQSALHDPSSFETRRALLREHPELRARWDQHVRIAEQVVQDVLADGESSRALVLVAGTVMRFAYTPAADGSINRDPAALDAAIIRFREVLKEVL